MRILPTFRTLLKDALASSSAVLTERVTMGAAAGLLAGWAFAWHPVAVAGATLLGAAAGAAEVARERADA